MLAELTRKREKEKLRQAQVIKDIVDSFIFPYYGKLRLMLEKISAYVQSLCAAGVELTFIVWTVKSCF